MRELRTLSHAAATYLDIIGQADELAYNHHPPPTPVDPWEEIERRLPMLLSSLSPEARDLIADHTRLMSQLVSAVTETFGSRPHLTLARLSS